MSCRCKIDEKLTTERNNAIRSIGHPVILRKARHKTTISFPNNQTICIQLDNQTTIFLICNIFSRAGRYFQFKLNLNKNIGRY